MSPSRDIGLWAGLFFCAIGAAACCLVIVFNLGLLLGWFQ